MMWTHEWAIFVPIIFFGTIASVFILGPLARAWGKRLERGAGQPVIAPDVAARLQRMEQAIESIAIEVERISEGQRFTTKLLSERSVDKLQASTKGNRQ